MDNKEISEPVLTILQTVPWKVTIDQGNRVSWNLFYDENTNETHHSKGFRISRVMLSFNVS